MDEYGKTIEKLRIIKKKQKMERDLVNFVTSGFLDKGLGVQHLLEQLGFLFMFHFQHLLIVSREGVVPER